MRRFVKEFANSVIIKDTSNVLAQDTNDQINQILFFAKTNKITDFDAVRSIVGIRRSLMN